MAARLIDRLRRAREVLGGVDEAGNRVHPSMFDPEVISLAHGDGTCRPAHSVVAAGVAALLETARGSLEDYLFLQRHDELESAITADFVAQGIPAEAATNVCSAGGTTRLFAAFLHACAAPGDLFGVSRSYYHPLPGWCELHGVELDLIPTEVSSGYKLTPGALDDWCTRGRRHGRRPRGLFLFNPTQTGALYTREELIGLAEVARRGDLLILEDSVFAGTEFPGQPPVRHLAAAAPDLIGRVVTLKGGSKAYNLANIRIGWGCGPAEIIRRMNDYTVTTSATVPFLAKEMALAALRAPGDYLTVNARECARRAALIDSLVEECNEEIGAPEPVLTVPQRPQAGHAILVAAPGLLGRRMPAGATIAGSIDVTRFLLSAANVATSPGYSLGFDGTELRLAFGSVGVRHTYPKASAGELGSVLGRLTGMCGTTHPDVARWLERASEVAIAGAQEPAADPFRAGRDLITTAFRERITPAIRRLAGHRTMSLHSGGTRGSAR
jgi:aspartate aminotransferase